MPRVLHLTDPHLFADPDGALRGTITRETLSAVLADYRDSGWKADLAIVTGDLVQDDSEGAYVHFSQMLASLQLPVYCLPGNHDIRALMREALSKAPFHYCGSVTSNGWLIACVDSCVAESAGGSVSEGELQRLERQLDETAEQNVLVCLHHPPVPMGSKWLDSVGLDNGGEFLQRISTSGKVRAAIFGHVHQEYDAVHNGIRIIGTPSTCRQFAKGSDEFAVDDNPPAYRRIMLHDNGDFESELVWLGQTTDQGS